MNYTVIYDVGGEFLEVKYYRDLSNVITLNSAVLTPELPFVAAVEVDLTLEPEIIAGGVSTRTDVTPDTADDDAAYKLTAVYLATVAVLMASLF